MSRSSRGRNRASGTFSSPGPSYPATDDLARLLGPLDHPASVSETQHSTPPLMRTVPGDRIPGSRSSPLARSRASIRSRAVTPWEQARLLSPQLTARALICARRSIRREVLFAIKGTGKGAKARRNYTKSTKVRC